MSGLETGKSVAGIVVPSAAGLSVEVVLADQRVLDFAGALAVGRCLATRTRLRAGLFAMRRTSRGFCRFPAMRRSWTEVGCAGVTRFLVVGVAAQMEIAANCNTANANATRIVLEKRNLNL